MGDKERRQGPETALLSQRGDIVAPVFIFRRTQQNRQFR